VVALADESRMMQITIGVHTGCQLQLSSVQAVTWIPQQQAKSYIQRDQGTRYAKLHNFVLLNTDLITTQVSARLAPCTHGGMKH
jgi:hypothetical protein